MPMTRTALKAIGSAAAVALVAACSPTVANHGYRLDEAAISQIKPGVSDRGEVARLLGSPSSMSTFNDSTWYYISQKVEQRSFYQSRIDSQDVLKIDFDASGKVRDMGQHGLEMAQAIDPAGEKTRTMGNELTLVQQFVGNIGRFNAGDPAESAAASRAGAAARRGQGGSYGGSGF